MSSEKILVNQVEKLYVKSDCIARGAINKQRVSFWHYFRLKIKPSWHKYLLDTKKYLPISKKIGGGEENHGTNNDNQKEKRFGKFIGLALDKASYVYT